MAGLPTPCVYKRGGRPGWACRTVSLSSWESCLSRITCVMHDNRRNRIESLSRTYECTCEDVTGLLHRNVHGGARHTTFTC